MHKTAAEITLGIVTALALWALVLLVAFGIEMAKGMV